MLNFLSLTSVKPKLKYMRVCIVVNGESSKPCADLGLDPVLPIVELIQDILI